MAPTIHLVRHAQGYHNLSVENESIHDPDLTPLGLTQCAALRSAFPHHASVRALVASPIRRTTYTCMLGFGPESASDGVDPELYPITALDLLQEVSAQPCDVGSDVGKLKEEFGGKVNYETVSEGWTDKAPGDSPFEPTMEKLAKRGRAARRALREIAKKTAGEDGHIVAVTHGGFLHFLTDDWHEIPEGHGLIREATATAWANCEYRTYQFVDATGEDEDAALKETVESWTRRRGSAAAPTATETETERREMRAVVQKRVAPYLRVNA